MRPRNASVRQTATELPKGRLAGMAIASAFVETASSWRKPSLVVLMFAQSCKVPSVLGFLGTHSRLEKPIQLPMRHLDPWMTMTSKALEASAFQGRLVHEILMVVRGLTMQRKRVHHCALNLGLPTTRGVFGMILTEAVCRVSML
jgi:hypothetical protein